MSRRCVVAAGLALAALGLLALPALAQGTPFGIRPPQPAGPDGILGWILAVQAGFYRDLSQALRAARSDGAAAFSLIALSLAYGVFHAAGPGHGKAVISAYILANEATWRRGVALAFAAAMTQATVAVLVVVVAAAVLKATAVQLGATVRWVEIASYGAIAALGAWLAVVKGRALAAAWSGRRAGCGPGCDHLTPVDVRTLAGPGGLKRAAIAALAAGLRPCSGALVVLVVALTNGILWLGVASTFAMALGTALTVAALAALAVFAKAGALRLAAASSGRGELVLRGVELLAALAVAALGAALLAGYLVTERGLML